MVIDQPTVEIQQGEVQLHSVKLRGDANFMLLTIDCGSKYPKLRISEAWSGGFTMAKIRLEATERTVDATDHKGPTIVTVRVGPGWIMFCDAVGYLRHAAEVAFIRALAPDFNNTTHKLFDFDGLAEPPKHETKGQELARVLLDGRPISCGSYFGRADVDEALRILRDDHSKSCTIDTETASAGGWIELCIRADSSAPEGGAG